MTYREHLHALKEEISSTKARYSALAKEISARACKGEEISELVREHNRIFGHFNDLFTRHVHLIQDIRKKKIRLDSMMPGPPEQ